MSIPQLFSTNSLGNWLRFQTSTGNFNSNYTLSFPLATDTAVYESFTQNLSNKTFTLTTITDASNTVTAQRLGTAAGTGFDVVINGTTPSGANKVLVTSSATAAAWGTIPNAALTNSSITINTGTGLSGGGVVALGGTLNLSNTGVSSGIHVVVASGNSFESKSNIYLRCGNFVYNGTASSDGTISKIIVLAYTTNPSTYHRWRVFDVTNTQIIATSTQVNTGTASAPVIVDLGTVSNLPVGPNAKFEIQLLATNATGSTGVAGVQNVGICDIQVYF